MERIGESDRADEFRDMSTDEYAEGKGLRITNPRYRKRSRTMPAATSPSKTDLQDQIDRAIETLDDAYTPESTREDLAEAMGEALGILRGEDEESDTDEDEIDEDDEDLD
jgi:hypothetical protein